MLFLHWSWIRMVYQQFICCVLFQTAGWKSAVVWSVEYAVCVHVCVPTAHIQYAFNLAFLTLLLSLITNIIKNTPMRCVVVFSLFILTNNTHTTLSSRTKQHPLWKWSVVSDSKLLRQVLKLALFQCKTLALVIYWMHMQHYYIKKPGRCRGVCGRSQWVCASMGTVQGQW